MEYQNRVFGSHLIIVNEVGSTNKELLEHADDYEHGTVLCARRQTAGKGRHLRDWHSQNGGLYFSLLLKDQKDIESIYPFVLLSALSVVRCIQSCATLGVMIKWPNDVYINHRKVCGILAESSTRGNRSNIVIGIGINVNNSVSHLKDLRHPAVSLKECRGEEMDIIILLNRIIVELDQFYEDYRNGRFSQYLQELNRLLYAKGQKIELFTDKDKKLIVPLCFTEDAQLKCLVNGKETIIHSGEM